MKRGFVATLLGHTDPNPGPCAGELTPASRERNAAPGREAARPTTPIQIEAKSADRAHSTEVIRPCHGSQSLSRSRARSRSGLGATATAQAAQPQLEVLSHPAEQFERSIETQKLELRYRGLSREAATSA